MPKVIHFEIPAADPEKASQFYTDVFGWQITPWGGEEPYWIVNAGPPSEQGINGGLMRRQGAEHSVAVVIGVDNVDAYLPKIEAAGGVIVLPKMPIPGIGYVAYFKDLDGHVVGVYHDDPNATA